MYEQNAVHRSSVGPMCFILWTADLVFILSTCVPWTGSSGKIVCVWLLHLEILCLSNM